MVLRPHRKHKPKVSTSSLCNSVFRRRLSVSPYGSSTGKGYRQVRGSSLEFGQSKPTKTSKVVEFIHHRGVPFENTFKGILFPARKKKGQRLLVPRSDSGGVTHGDTGKPGGKPPRCRPSFGGSFGRSRGDNPADAVPSAPWERREPPCPVTASSARSALVK